MRIEEHRQQCREIEDKMDDNEVSNNDESMSSVTMVMMMKMSNDTAMPSTSLRVEASLYMIMVVISISSILLYALLASTSKRA